MCEHIVKRSGHIDEIKRNAIVLVDKMCVCVCTRWLDFLFSFSRIYSVLIDLQ